MPPIVDERALAHINACAFNAHDVECICQHARPSVRVIRDGRLIGVGPNALRDGIEAEYRSKGEAFARVLDIDGRPVLAEFTGDEGNEVVKGIISFTCQEGRMDELRIDHGDARLLTR